MVAADVSVVFVLPHNGPNDAALIASITATTAAAGFALVVSHYGEGTASTTYGAAANAGARAATTPCLIFAHASVPAAADGFVPLIAALDRPGAGVAGPRIVTNDGSGDVCGYMVSAAPYTFRGFELQKISNLPALLAFDALPSDCIATTRAMYDRAGGFPEAFEADHTAFDFCFRVAEAGGSVLIEPRTIFARYGPVVNPNDPVVVERERAFGATWRGRVETHENFWPELLGSLGRGDFNETGIALERIPVPPITVLVHGDTPPDATFSERVWQSRLAPSRVVWAAAGPAPSRAVAVPDAIDAARELTEVRGLGLVAFVRTDTQLAPDWLNDLVNTIGRLPEVVAGTITGPVSSTAMSDTADARCTLVALRSIPQHLRIERSASLDASVATWLRDVVNAGRTIVPVTRTATVVGPLAAGIAFGEATVAPVASEDNVFASIVMLSWNAPEFTELAVASIREHTRVKHEIIIVDNGSDAETVARIGRIPDIRTIYNAVNTGFAFGCNQGIAAARGTHVVLLNNDVIVTDGWLEAMLAVQRKNPAIGCSGPRTNSIVGPQQIEGVPYGSDLAALPAFAAQRARDNRGGFTHQMSIIGFCMVLPRCVIDEIGGLDPRYGTGNFEDDDYCVRIRAAGYDMAVCEDSFIHHFGSVSFARNNIDYRATMAANRARFLRRWNVPDTGGAYDARLAFSRGFVRATDYVALPAATGVGADWVRPV
jgi:GT2 family glycosyltransferase